MKLTPMASALINTSPGPGVGSGVSTWRSTSGPPVSLTSIACMWLSCPGMKLARPDVFHPRIVLAGCAEQVAGDGDDAGLLPALRHRGLHARWLAWDDPETGRADLVIVRATHDYADRLDEFLAWTTRVANLLNAPTVVAWNAHRRYLADLAGRGVPTVAGEFFAPGERVRLPRTGDVFVGTAVGTGTRRFSDR